MTCDAAHDGHICDGAKACDRALLALCDRVGSRDRGERDRDLIDLADVSMSMTVDEYRARS